MSETLDPVATELDQRQLAEQLLAQAKEEGVEPVGPNGLLNQLTKNVLETTLDAEMAEHLGYDKHDPVGRGSGNSRNGTRAKTVLTRMTTGCCFTPIVRSVFPLGNIRLGEYPNHVHRDRYGTAVAELPDGAGHRTQVGLLAVRFGAIRRPDNACSDGSAFWYGAPHDGRNTGLHDRRGARICGG